MPERSTATQLLAQLATTLSERSIGYVIIGGQAVLLHGEPRFTDDIDVTVLVPPYEPEPIHQICHELGLTPKFEGAQEFARLSLVLPCRHAQSGFGVDIAFADSPYERLVIDRAERHEVAGVPVMFVGVEDLLVQKLIAFRPQDRLDILSILNRQANVDLGHIRHWLRQFEQVIEDPLLERLEEMLAQQRRRLGDA